MLAPRLAKALREKVLLKLHRIRKLPGSLNFGGTLFWIITELLSLRKAAEICLILCLLLMSYLRNFPYLGIPAKTPTSDVEDMESAVCIVWVTELSCRSFGLTGGLYDLPLLVNTAFTCSLRDSGG
ncbi:hypothetical protein Tco_0679244 [Tanacetum coccineum]|uniref:Uncharacterized protein n=1 Tax=Tanacetum coccineum TaxID=301880 RepID=A0ABQ4XH96_9ASTR